MLISESSKNELEFFRIIQQIQNFSLNEFSRNEFLKISPYSKELAFQHLLQTNEYLSSLESQNPVPFREFPIIFDVLKVLTIENYQLDVDAFVKLRDLQLLVNQIIVFLEKFKIYFPTLHQHLQNIPFSKEIILAVDSVFNRFGEVKNDASSDLKFIREQINQKRKIITELFGKSLAFCAQNGILDEIRESIIDNQRCLAVKSAMKKRIKGRTLGLSKTGSISFIIPEAIIPHQNELIEYVSQEKHEIRRILLELTQKISIHFDLISAYQDYVLHLDLIQAKAKYAQSIRACLPKINHQKSMNLIQAYNPVLFVTNEKERKKTFPQTIHLDENNRILCISGPNAGGKSITLKTIGILQVMLQSGILVPVHQKSEMFFFEQLLTDIGDNQSIENHLSTYSARLERMSQIIKTSNENTLVLIDEFGTGSDPELGGVLAEAFLEYFYEKRSFAIITTHYTNIKLKVEHLASATNAAMLFDEKTLTPIYKLAIGQAGSSFTFEVAEKNHIPRKIIQKAKEKLQRQKVNLDKTLIQLQQQKYEIEKIRTDLTERLIESEQTNKEIKQTEKNIKKKLFDFQNLYNEEQKYVQLGKKFDSFIKDYSNGKTKKEVFALFMKIVEQEKFKIKKEEKPIISIGKKKKEILQKEVKKQLNDEEIKTEIQETVQQVEKENTEKQKQKLVVGTKVKIKGSTSIGTIEKIEKDNLFINYGVFTTKINIFEVEKV